MEFGQLKQCAAREAVEAKGQLHSGHRQLWRLLHLSRHFKHGLWRHDRLLLRALQSLGRRGPVVARLDGRASRQRGVPQVGRSASGDQEARHQDHLLRALQLHQRAHRALLRAPQAWRLEPRASLARQTVSAQLC